MLNGLKRLFGGRRFPTIERLARGCASVGLPMGADAAVLAKTEQTNGIPVPDAVRTFLAKFTTLGSGLFDPTGRSQHSRALSRLLDSVDRDFDPLGVVGPSREDVGAGRRWWYFVFGAKPGVKRFAVWDGMLALRAGTGEENLAAAESKLGIRFPESYRHLTLCFDQVLHSGLHLHEGTVGPEPGACTQGYDGERAYMRMWVEAAEQFFEGQAHLREWAEAAGEQGPMAAEDISNYVPIYAGPYGDVHLFSRDDAERIFLFDHETCGVSQTPYADFDAFFDDLLDGRL